MSTILDSEVWILGSVLQDPEALPAIRASVGLRPEHFRKRALGLIFDSTIAVATRGDPVDVVTVSTELQRRQHLDQVGGNEFLASLPENVPTTANVVYHAHVVAEDAAKRRFAVEAETLAKEAANGLPLADLRTRAERVLESLRADEPQTSPEVAFVPAEELWGEPDEAIEYDIEGLIVRSSQGWVSAGPKHCKSILTTHIASRIASGRPVLDHYPVPTPRRVLLVQEEDPRPRLRRRLKALVQQEERDAWGGRLLLLIEAGLKLDDAQWQRWLVEQIERHRAEVLILDVWRWLHHADTNKEVDLKPILAFLTDIRRRQGVTILVVTHDSKPKQGPEGDKRSARITGNWVQWAWAHFGLFLKKAGSTVQVEVEGKDAQDIRFAFRFDGGEDGQPLRLVWEPAKVGAGEERRRLLAEYLQERKGEWIDLATLANAVGVSDDTAQKDLGALGSDPGFETSKMPFGRTRKRVYRYVGSAE